MPSKTPQPPPTTTSGRHRSSKAGAKGKILNKDKARSTKRAKKTTASMDNLGEFSDEERDGKSKRGTRTTGAGSHSIRNRSIFAPSPPKQNLDSKSLRKATLAALAGEMTASTATPGSSSGRGGMMMGSGSGGRRQVLHAKLSPNGLLFRMSRIHSKDDDAGQEGVQVVSLTAQLDEARKTLNADGTASVQASSVDARIVRDDSDDNLDDVAPASASASASASDWIPIEGIYGIYSLPSGPHAVLITRSEEAYSSPPVRPRKESDSLLSGVDNFSSQPLLQFRRIVSMEIVRVPTKSKSTLPDISIPQRKSEERQLRLLRRSFREHDLYFVPPSDSSVPADSDDRIELALGGPIVADITHPLQRSFASAISHEDNPLSSSRIPWWHSIVDGGADGTLYKPDSRFFWNEEHLKSLIPPIANPNNPRVEDNPHTLLLDWTFPVTSAFLGVQRKIQTCADIEKGKQQTGSEPPSVVYDELLISRRSKYRAGTRFTRRGADGTGSVTNYAETEQICLVLEAGSKSDGTNIEYLEEIYSHVQTRGSIPLRWSSPADVKTYRPRVLIGTDPLAQARALRNHLDEQMRLYSTSSSGIESGNPTSPSKKEFVKLSFVNLIDKHSDQGRLGRAFDSVLHAVLDVYSNGASAIEKDSSDAENDSVADIRYGVPPSADISLAKGSVNHIWFDFHAECKGGRWDKLESLLRELTPVLDKQGYFCAVPSGGSGDACTGWQVLSAQDGVIRTNCMDCLDRTNVVQSIFGRYILYKQLQERLGLKERRNKTDGHSSSIRRSLPMGYVVAFRRNALKLPWSQGETSHRLLWADNADAISRLYAGTPALKGDFTRTGKRTKRGALDDGINSLQRYYLNNFIDADRQEGMDLLVGRESFAIVDDTDIDESAPDYMSGGADGKEAFRKMLLFGSNSQRGSNIEAGRALRRGLLSTGDVSGAGGANPLELDFNWLPGDLKSHMRSSAVLAEERRSELLKSIDSRSSRALPWWVREDATSDDEAVVEIPDGDVSLVVPQAENSIVPSGGHLLGTLVAASRAPLATALTIVCVMSTGILSNLAQSNDDNTDDESDGEES